MSSTVDSWYGACPSPESMHQSPIILSQTYSQQTEEFGPFHFIKYDKEGKKIRVENTGHTVKFEIAGRHRYTVQFFVPYQSTNQPYSLTASLFSTSDKRWWIARPRI